jgi:hypothetical protein
MRRFPLLVAAVAALAVAVPAQASTTQRVLFQAPHELVGADDALRQQTLREIADLGVRDLRITMYWKAVAPDAGSRDVPSFNERDPAGYDWGGYGAAVDAARQAGFRVLLTVSGPVPVWATAGKRDDRTRPSAQRFERFMQAVGRRFGAEVDAYSVWNEPNHPQFLLPQYSHGHPASGTIYRRLYQAARKGLQAVGQGDKRLLFGETAPRGTSKVVAPLRFLRQALCVTSTGHRRKGCKPLGIDGIAHHPYTTSAGPTFVPPNRDDVTIGVLSRLDSFVRTAERAHAIPSGTRIALTEFGVQSYPDPYAGVSYTTQAESRSIGELMAQRDARVNYFSQYLMRDDAPRAGPVTRRYSGFESGLRRYDGSAKRAYDAFRLPLVVHPVSRSRVRMWGLVRPASGRTRVSLWFRTRGSKHWSFLLSAKTDRHGRWTAHGLRRKGREYRVHWRDPSGAVHSGALTRVRHT